MFICHLNNAFKLTQYI